MAKIISFPEGRMPKRMNDIEREDGEFWTNYFKRLLDHNGIKYNPELGEDSPGFFENNLWISPIFHFSMDRYFDVDQKDLEHYPKPSEFSNYFDLTEKVGEFIVQLRDRLTLCFRGYSNSFLDFYFSPTDVASFGIWKPRKDFGMYIPSGIIAGIQGEGFRYADPGEYSASKVMKDLIAFSSDIKNDCTDYHGLKRVD